MDVDAEEKARLSPRLTSQIVPGYGALALVLTGTTVSTGEGVTTGAPLIVGAAAALTSIVLSLGNC